MLGISLKDRIRNEEIRRRTKVVDIMDRVAKLKWERHVARQGTERWAPTILK